MSFETERRKGYIGPGIRKFRVKISALSAVKPRPFGCQSAEAIFILLQATPTTIYTTALENSVLHSRHSPFVLLTCFSCVFAWGACASVRFVAIMQIIYCVNEM